MTGDWRRYGNFYERITGPQHEFADYRVVYTNWASFAMVRGVTVSKTLQGDVIVLIQASSSSHHDALVNACKSAKLTQEECDTGDLNTKSNIVEITIRGSQATVKKTMSLLNILNAQADAEFPADFITDFARLFNQTKLPNEQRTHIIPEMQKGTVPAVNVNHAHVNPEKKDDITLLKITDPGVNQFFSEDKFLSVLKSSLVAGHDPNQMGPHGETPLKQALWLPVAATELLLAYFANPFFMYVNGEYPSYSIFEYALYFGKKDHISVFIASFTKVGKSIWVSQTELLATKDKITATYRFADGTHYTMDLKNLTQLKKEEKESLYTAYTQCFEVVNKDKNPDNDRRRLREDFEGSFSVAEKKLVSQPSDPDAPQTMKLVKLIFLHDKKKPEERKIVGAALFELLKIKKLQKIVVLHCEYGFLLEEARPYMSTKFEIYNLAPAIALLVPNQIVAVFSSDVDEHSYLMIHKILHGSKYLSEHVKRIMEEIIPRACGYAKTVFQHDMTWPIKEECPVQVVQSKDKANISLWGRFFEKYLIGSVKGAYGPQCYFLGEDSYREFAHSAMMKGIDYELYVATEARLFVRTGLFEGFLYQEKPRLVERFYLLKNRELFWQNKAVASNESIDPRRGLETRSSL